jgi:hypothetical protein
MVQEVGLFEIEGGVGGALDDDGDVVGVALDDAEVLLPAFLGRADLLELGLVGAESGDSLEEVHVINT